MERFYLHESIAYEPWIQNLKICVFDLETTGFIDEQTYYMDWEEDREEALELCSEGPYIVQIYMQIVKDGFEIDEPYHSLVKPPISIPEGASKAHKIYDEHVQDAPEFSEISEEIMEYILRADIACAYNHRFDLNVLNCEQARIDGEILRIPFLDPLPFEIEKRGKKSGNTLLEACSRRNLGKIASQVLHEDVFAHNAKTDVEMLQNLLISMGQSSDIPWSLIEALEQQKQYIEKQDAYWNRRKK